MTDMYLFNVEYDNDSIRLKDGKFLNAFYKDGYNNQCAFIDSTLVYFSSGFESVSTDIYAIDILQKNLWRVTHTLEAEYSPRKIPFTDSISVVRIEKDGKTQSLWKYPLDQSHSGQRLLPHIDNIGYYSWIDNDNLALYLVDDPNRLVLVNLKTHSLSILSENIGRCLKTSTDGELYFVQRNEDKDLFLKKYNPRTKQLTFIAKCIGKTEDFELIGDQFVLMGNGSDIMQYNMEFGTDWRTVADLEEYGINDISRIEVFNAYLILINKR